MNPGDVMYIREQKATKIYNAEGGQYIGGDQPGTSLEDARFAAEGLQQALSSSPSREFAAMHGHVDAIAAEMRRQTPDRHTVADRLRKVTDLINASASLASAGAAIIGPLRTLAEWLGDLGVPILHMLR